MKSLFASIGWVFWAATALAGTVGTPPQLVAEGSYYFNAGDYERAIRCCDEALKVDPTYVDAWLTKGAAYVNLCRYKKALKCYEKAAALNPEDAQAWAGRADVLRYEGRPREALVYYEKALALDSVNTGYLAGKGDALIEGGSYDEGAAILDDAAEASPTAWTYYYRGLGALGRGRYDEAARAFSSSASLNDSLFIYSYLLLYITKTSAGDADARDVLGPALAWPTRLWPRDVARLYAGEATPADVLAAAGEDRVKQCEAYCFLGYYYQYAGDAKTARSYFKKAVRTGVHHDMEYRLAKRELAPK